MNTKGLSILLFLFFVFSGNTAAQSFLDKVLKGVEKTNQILDETDKMLGNDGQPSSSREKSKRISGFQIVSPHPDLEIQFKRCAIAGSTAVLDLVITNYGSDIQVQLGGSSYTTLFDDAGNQYSNTEVSIANGDFKTWSTALLPTDVPIKFRLQVSEISSQATIFKRININIHNKTLNLKEPIMLYNVPIARRDNSVSIVPSSAEGTTNSSMGSLGKENTDEDFSSFEEKFISNPRFQMQRILFDNLGQNGEGHTWTKENWVLLDKKPSSRKSFTQYKYKQELGVDDCMQAVWIDGSNFKLEYTYTKVDGKWNLAKAVERF